MSLISSGNLGQRASGYGYGGLNLDNNELYIQNGGIYGYPGPYYSYYTKANLTAMTSTNHTIYSDYNFYNCSAYHNGFAYFGTGYSRSGGQWILKLQTSDMSKVSELAISDVQVPAIGEFYAGLKIDTTRNILYTCSYKDAEPLGGVICKIDLSTFTLVSYASIETTGASVLGFSLDEINQKIYCIDDGDYGSLDSTVYVVDCITMTVLDSLSLPNSGDPYYRSGDKGSAIDVANGYVLFSTAGDSYTELPTRVWKIGLYNPSPYPPADPIDDNPDTLPDPGGDPQEITFRYETYKAIRSDESLLK
jgi:hypothetical protein